MGYFNDRNEVYLMKKVLVLGGGRIGAAIAKNLSVDHDVTLAEVLAGGVGTPTIAV